MEEKVCGKVAEEGVCVPTMTERCSLWSALSAAACCFYRGSFMQVQVSGCLCVCVCVCLCLFLECACVEMHNHTPFAS